MGVNNMEILATILILFLLLIFIVSIVGNNSKPNNHELKQLDTMIHEKRIELSQIEQQIKNKSYNRGNNLSNVVNEVLDIYEQSNIKIPLDIIEELQYMSLSDEKQVFEYIENQRNHWKLENNKKPYRKV